MVKLTFSLAEYSTLATTASDIVKMLYLCQCRGGEERVLQTRARSHAFDFDVVVTAGRTRTRVRRESSREGEGGEDEELEDEGPRLALDSQGIA
jgi:hypothetical protein